MESLGQLNGALPPPSQASEELQKAFRHAALSITTMYQASKKASATAYLAGKKEALQDVLEFLQASLDHPQPTSSTVSRLIDYVCARQEAIKAEEEDNDDDDNSPPPQRSQSAAPAPPSPHRPGPFQHRASTSSTATLPTHSAPLSRSTSSYQPRSAPAPVASTSSAPPSPSFSPASVRTHALSRPNPFPPFSLSSSSTSTPVVAPAVPSLPVSISASPSPLSSTVNLPLSPLGRAHGHIHQTHHPRSLRSRTSSRGKSTATATNHSAAASGHSTPTGATTNFLPQQAGGLEAAELGGGEQAALFGLGMKRRWGIPTAGDVVDVVAIDARDDDDGEDDNLGQRGRDRREESVGGGGTGEGMEMEMEGWDGVGERPFKRVARNFRRDLADSDEDRDGGGGGEGGAGSREEAGH